MRIADLLIKMSLLFLCMSCMGQNVKNTKQVNKEVKKEYKYASMKDGILHLDLNEARKHPREVKLSEICDSLIYIPLETRKECLLGRHINEVEFTKDFIFIQEGWSLYQFSREGKFIRQIGKTGRGPGEYVCGGLCIDEQNQRLLVKAIYKNRVFEYDFTGVLLADTLQYSNQMNNMNYSSKDNTIRGSLKYCITKKSKRFKSFNILSKLSLDDNSESFVSSKYFPEKYYNSKGKMGLMLQSSNLYSFNGYIHYQELGSDTIFRCVNEKSYPHIILNSKSFFPRFQSSLFEDVTSQMLRSKKAYNILKLIPSMISNESDRYIFIDRYSDYNYIYDKKTYSLTSIKSSDDNLFINDMDCIFKQRSISVKGNKYLSTCILPEDIIALKEAYDTISSKDLSILNKITEDLTEESNPVLVLARLKK